MCIPALGGDGVGKGEGTRTPALHRKAQPLTGVTHRKRPKLGAGTSSREPAAGRGGWGWGAVYTPASWGRPGTHPPRGRATGYHLLGSCPGRWNLLVLALSSVLCDSGNAALWASVTTKNRRRLDCFFQAHPFRQIKPTAFIQQKEYEHLKDGTAETPPDEGTCSRSWDEPETKGRATALGPCPQERQHHARLWGSELSPDPCVTWTSYSPSLIPSFPVTPCSHLM